ncbi:hypothetical protein DPMN_085681 [Dreissena polymorpha]|uniref:Uncharacterized protein n=1 Tax=Dreissena polymorpha TaxID=45954 RepID=A0A9D3YGY2_DREPO|nr:hypothetical protein DPMN_085681 [Dreissena polymorpha]
MSKFIVTSNSNLDGSNIDVNIILKNALRSAGNAGNAQTWQNSFKGDTPSVQNYRDIKVSTSNTNPDGSNIDVNNVLKNALGSAGNAVNAQSWQNASKGDTPSLQNYRDFKVSNGNSDGSDVDVSKLIKDAIGNAGRLQACNNPYKADSQSV